MAWQFPGLSLDAICCKWPVNIIDRYSHTHYRTYTYCSRHHVKGDTKSQCERPPMYRPFSSVFHQDYYCEPPQRCLCVPWLRCNSLQGEYCQPSELKGSLTMNQKPMYLKRYIVIPEIYYDIYDIYWCLVDNDHYEPLDQIISTTRI